MGERAVFVRAAPGVPHATSLVRAEGVELQLLSPDRGPRARELAKTPH